MPGERDGWTDPTAPSWPPDWVGRTGMAFSPFERGTVVLITIA